MKRAGAAAELHIYATGGHGFRVRSGRPGSLWTRECANWMRNQGMVGSPKRVNSSRVGREG